ncbi:hypothetical protein CRYUN_Cryun16bG0047500 [Craigia yunnanensis]
MLLYSEMIACGVFPNVFTINVLVHSFAKVDNLSFVLEFLRRVDYNNNVDTVTYNTLIWGFCEQGFGFSVLNGQKRNTLVNGGISKDVIRKKDLNILDGNHHQNGGDNSGILEPNLITHTTLISAYCKQEALEEALSLYEEMVVNGILPDAVTYSSIINSLCKHGKLAEAKVLLREMEKMGNSMDAFTLQSLMFVCGIAFDVVVYTILMDGFFKVRKPKEAENMFITLLQHKLVPNSTNYSALIDGRCKLEDINGAESALEEMKEKNVVPNVVTYSSIINSYIRKGMLDEAVNI